MKVFWWSYGNNMYTYACITAYCTIWQKRVTGLHYHLFATQYFKGFPIPESTASTSPSCLQSLSSRALLSVQCSMMKHCWKAGRICTAKLYPHNFTGSPDRAWNKVRIPELDCWQGDFTDQGKVARQIWRGTGQLGFQLGAWCLWI